jgi:MFS family permease
VKTQRLYYGWIVAASSLIIGVLIYGIRYSYGVFFKSLEQDFGLNRTLTSGVFSSYMILAAVFAILGGWALDRYGPKIVVILMGLFTGLSLFLTSQANSLWHIAISYSLLLAIGTGPVYVVTMATASRWFIKRRGLALAIVSSGAGLGIMVMTPIAAYLVSNYGWQTAYSIMALVALLTIVPCALLLRKRPTEVAVLPNGETLATTNPAPPQQPTQIDLEDLSLSQAAKSRNFWLFFFIWLLYSLCVHLVLTHLVPHIIDLGITPIKAAAIVTWLGGTTILGRLLMGRLSDIIDRKQVAIVSSLLMAGGMLLLTGVSDLWLLYLFAVIFGFGYGGLDPPVAALIGEVFGLRNIGVIMGALVIGWSAGAAVGSTLGGYIFDISGNYVSAFLVSMVAMLTVAALIMLLARQQAPMLPENHRGVRQGGNI